MSKNLKIKLLVSLIAFLLIDPIVYAIIAIGAVQLISMVAERIINVFAEEELRLKINKAFPKWSVLDSENKIKYKRPLAFVWSAIKSFYQHDFEKTDLEEADTE